MTTSIPKSDLLVKEILSEAIQETITAYDEALDELNALEKE